MSLLLSSSRSIHMSFCSVPCHSDSVHSLNTHAYISIHVCTQNICLYSFRIFYYWTQTSGNKFKCSWRGRERGKNRVQGSKGDDVDRRERGEGDLGGDRVVRWDETDTVET